MDQAAEALSRLAEGLDSEEQEAYENQEYRDDEADDPPLDRWIDFRDGLTEEQRNEIDLSICLVQTTLTKVSMLLSEQS